MQGLLTSVRGASLHCAICTVTYGPSVQESAERIKVIRIQKHIKVIRIQKHISTLRSLP